MWSRNAGSVVFAVMLAAAVPSMSQSFRVQCPTTTITHATPTLDVNGHDTEPAYSGATTFTTDSTGQYLKPNGNINGAIKCQQISGGDGYSTMANGTQIFMFSFGPLSGLADIAKSLPGTQYPDVFNTPYPGNGGNTYLMPGDPATTDL